MPGDGQSEKPITQSTALDAQEQVLAQMLRHWCLSKQGLVTHDFDGAITLRAHPLHGYPYEGYVLMNVVAMRPWGSDSFDHVSRHSEAFAGLPPPIHKGLVEAYVQDALAHDLAADDFDALVKPWLSMQGAASFYRQFAQADEHCPASLVWGEDDPWIRPPRGKALHALMAGTSFTTIARAGHLPQLEKPEAVLRAIQSFLT